jgi:hypothetical protein
MTQQYSTTSGKDLAVALARAILSETGAETGAAVSASASTPGMSGSVTQPSFSMQELATSLARAFLEAPEEGGGGSSSSCTQTAARSPISGGQSVGGRTRLQDVLRDLHAKVQMAAARERGSGQQPNPTAGS